MPSKILSPGTWLSACKIVGICAATWMAGSVSAGDPVISDTISVDSRFPAPMAEMTLKSHGSRIHGLVYQAQGPGPHPTVVLPHGFPATKRTWMFQAVRRAGFNVVFFHYRGSWGSEGDFSFTRSLRDVGGSRDSVVPMAGHPDPMARASKRPVPRA